MTKFTSQVTLYLVKDCGRYVLVCLHSLNSIFFCFSATWNDASRICLEQKAFLATIKSLDENEAVFNFLINSTLESAWLGLHDRGIFAGQQWVDKSPVSFVRWDSGQPDSNLGQQACVLMASNGFWRDNDCNAKRSYICKASIGMWKLSFQLTTVFLFNSKKKGLHCNQCFSKYETHGAVWFCV